MTSRRREFKRELGERRYRKIYILAVEGVKTEPCYFALFNNSNALIRVNCLKSGTNSAPLQVLARMTRYLKSQQIKDTDEAWLVIDKDHWGDEEINQLYNWSLQADNYGFALSNPKFEYWLLLHFEDGNSVNSSAACTQRLKKHLPNYDKGIDVSKISPQMINAAIHRAKQRDKNSQYAWPHNTGTNLYKLVESMINASKGSG